MTAGFSQRGWWPRLGVIGAGAMAVFGFAPFRNALVSSDLNHDPHSAIYASPLTKSMDGDLVKVIAWYDNEWGFANRMIDVARVMGQRLGIA